MCGKDLLLRISLSLSFVLEFQVNKYRQTITTLLIGQECINSFLPNFIFVSQTEQTVFSSWKRLSLMFFFFECRFSIWYERSSSPVIRSTKFQGAGFIYMYIFVQARRKRCCMAAVAAPKICRETEREKRKRREERKRKEEKEKKVMGVTHPLRTVKRW